MSLCDVTGYKLRHIILIILDSQHTDTIDFLYNINVDCALQARTRVLVPVRASAMSKKRKSAESGDDERMYIQASADRKLHVIRRRNYVI